jgi:2'-deoxynucleoside 5'-phosphate N-hydrolase
MNIYFACSITGGREFESVYQDIVAALTSDGHEIPTSRLVKSNARENERTLTPHNIYERDVNWIQNCDVLIAEVSVPSHGVGYEIGFALNIGKPVLCIHHAERRISKMITGNSDAILTVQAYSHTKEAISLTRIFLRDHKYL